MTEHSKGMRRAGSRWRIAVSEMVGEEDYGDDWHVASDRTLAGGTGEDGSVEFRGRTYWSRNIELPGTEFDELVVGDWIHLEQMAGVVLWVRVDEDGRPRRVDVYGPGDYDDPVPRVEYGGPALRAVWPPSRSAVGGEPEATSKSATERDDEAGADAAGSPDSPG